MAEHTIYYSPSFSEATHKATFTRDQINAAIGHALVLLKEGKQIGEAKFPHAYKTYPLPASAGKHAQPPIFEFPILLDGSLYKGHHSPGPDRVVFGSVATDYASADYVGIAGVGPDGAGATAPTTPGGGACGGGGSYQPHIFRDTSVNRGSGGDHSHAGHHHDHEGKTASPPLTPPEERELISAEDVTIHFSD